MEQAERLKRFVRALALTPHRVNHTLDLSASTQSEVADLRATLDASSKAYLEGLAQLTRSVGELNARLERIERGLEAPKG